ncbi:hypothetical protein IC231_09560 [Hymenobacter sp. BT646]|uniref:Glycine-rich domain-containing protein-like n=2 Tax=Hymenobacter duratus TaxID=2771356 RepID=A0ABR8JEJ8_9BACT|nr:hypothetical protein [Hymenobacter duratus]
MPLLQPELWDKIQRFELDDPAAALSFTSRLARENGWSLTFSLRAVAEYKRFIFLLCTTNQPLTPSDEVDQVWHLHLLYTRSYWIDFCQYTLQKVIHHGPTHGDRQERAKFNNWYDQTLKCYAEVFGQLPPPDLWPSPAVRFRPSRFQRVNLSTKWLAPRFSLPWYRK